MSCRLHKSKTLVASDCMSCIFSTSLASAPRSRAEVSLFFCFSANVALLAFLATQTHVPVCCPASGLPDTVSVVALPLTSCVAAWLFAFSTLAAWLFNNVLCSDLLPVYRLSSPYAEQPRPPRAGKAQAKGRNMSRRS